MENYKKFIEEWLDSGIYNKFDLFFIFRANVSKAIREGKEVPKTNKFTPEGVEGYIPYAGPLAGVLHQFSMGIRSGMSYAGARNIK